MDYASYYSLERYLFEVVHARFRDGGSLSAFDFFSIVIWKANRAKSKIAARLLQQSGSHGIDLESVCRGLTSSLYNSPTPRDRLRILMSDWGFRLPMASAILTVLWPDEFGVYDVRVCEQLDAHRRLVHVVRFDAVWEGYQSYLESVRAAAPQGLSLRDADRYLWGRSAAEQLHSDIAKGFSQASAETTPDPIR